MDRYIGLDAHSQTCTFAVMGMSGRRLKEQVLETNGKVLVDFVRTLPGRKHLCLEEGSQSEWLYELLRPHVDELVVMHPVKTAGPKSDSIDAWSMADRIRTGTIPKRVFKTCGVYSELRAAVQAHRFATADLVRAKNRLKAIYRARGISTEGREIYSAEARVKWIKKLPPHRRTLAKLLGAELDALTKIHSDAEDWLHTEAGKCPAVRLVASAPGIGIVRASQIVATVVSPERFRTRQQFWSYCGLGIVMRSSSDWTRSGAGWVRRDIRQCRGLNQNRNPLLKTVFKGAATTVEQTPSHTLHADYRRMIDAGRKPTLVRLTLARRIAAAVLAMWKKKEEYDPAKTSSNQSAA